MDEDLLADPRDMTAQEKTDQLVKSVDEDDLLGVVLVLYFMDEEQINSTSQSSNLSALETAGFSPTRNKRVRRFIVEVLL
ncbi:hypothetical protein JCM8547_000769, partial [Rhodosporidiobolus lusitaniae]